MQRDPFKQYMKDPDNKARIFVFISIAMIISTAMITIGTIIFILHALGFF